MSKSYTPTEPTNHNNSVPVADSVKDDNMGDQCSLTQAGLEEYNSRTYYDQPVFHHQKQSSYAQSEGYHSYVSSSDSSSATPFLDRLRQESELLSRQSLQHWSQNNHHHSTSVSSVTLNNHQIDNNINENNNNNNNSEEATSSTETLKWLGSMSDISAASNTTSSSAISGAASSPQRIVHSSKVHTPKRHNSESILYMNDDQMAVTNSPNDDTIVSSSSSLSSLSIISTSAITTIDSNNASGGGDGDGSSRNSLGIKTLIKNNDLIDDTNLLVQQQKSNELLQNKNLIDYNRQSSSSSPSSLSSIHEQFSTTTSSILMESSSLTTIKSEIQSTAASFLSISCNGLATNNSSNDSESNSSNSSITTTNGRIDNSIQYQTAANLTNSITTSPINLSSSNLNSSYRNNHRLFPINTYTETVLNNNNNKNSSNNIDDYKINQYSKSAQQQQQIHTRLKFNHNLSSSTKLSNCQSVADRINDLERQQNNLLSNSTNISYHQHMMPPATPSIGTTQLQQKQQQQHFHQHQIEQHTFKTGSTTPNTEFNQKFTFIDPSKTHRVSNPTLKAFQKNAVQSYFERQQHQQQQQQQFQQNTKENMNSNKNCIMGNLIRQQSLQPHYSPKEATISHVRNSLPATFSIASSTAQYHHHHVTKPLSSIPSHTQEILDNSMNQKHLQQLRQQHQLHQSSSSTHINNNDNSLSSALVSGTNNPPPPPPRSRLLMPIRRSSSASDYGDVRDRFMQTRDKILNNSNFNNNNNNNNNGATVQEIINPAISSFNDCGVPPPPPPRNRSAMPMRRTSSASDYAKIILSKQIISKELSGPMIMGPIISIDDWVPERPPKNPQLRIPSPDLPPPPMFTIETDSTIQDEPLPSPPPEILQNNQQHSSDQQEQQEQSLSPNRRNSFSGSPSRKAFYNALLLENMRPPSIPSKKPHNTEIIQPNRPDSSLSQSNKAHKVILNGKLDNHIREYEPTITKNRNNDVRVSIRKRLHNNPGNLQLVQSSTDIGNKGTVQNFQNQFAKLPPPLKPRMSIAAQENHGFSTNINNKFRCNSKASYLPRQSHDKLNTTDPVHGSYKLTLTSNEENINQNINSPTKLNIHSNNHSSELLNSTTKCKNLPDVLPVGVKLQQQHSGLPLPPTSTSILSSSNSDNNINNSNNNNQTTMYQSYPNMNMMITTTKPQNTQISPITTTQSSYTTISSSPTLNLNRSSYSISNSTNGGVISPKFMSKSTIDLKKTTTSTHLCETTKEKFHKITDNMLVPSQSENNIIKDEKLLNAFGVCGGTRREFQRTDVIRKLSLEELDPAEGQIVRAELVNTTLSTSPTISKSDEKLVYKRDSLRENIEKITQLQSQLMSSHFVENGNERKLLGYTAKTVKIESVAHLQSNNDNNSNKLNDDRRPLLSLSNLENIVQHNTTPQHTNCTISSPSSSSEISNEKKSTNENEIINQKPIQRTEIIVQVNAPRIETASQTDDEYRPTVETNNEPPSITNSIINSTERQLQNISSPPTNSKHEIDCDNLLKELVNLLRSKQGNEKLCEILSPVVYKTSADYVFGLYDTCIIPRSTTKRDVGTSPSLCENLNSCDSDSNNSKIMINNSTNLRYDDNNHIRNDIRESTNDVENNSCDFRKKKEELINRLTQKHDLLTKEQISITDVISSNEKLGNELLLKISEKVRSIEVTKFKAYVDDIGYITKLLLSLAGRLAKMDNNIHGNNENHSEMKILEKKRLQLSEQLDEAKRLKEDIDRRGTNVYKIIKMNLSNDDCADYDYFINMKAKLIVNIREINDKIKLCEEQLSMLKDTLVQIES